MARIIIQLSKDSSMADVDQLIKEVKRKKYVEDAWLVRESDYASQQSVQADLTDQICYNGNHASKDGICVVDGGLKPSSQ